MPQAPPGAAPADDRAPSVVVPHPHPRDDGSMGVVHSMHEGADNDDGNADVEDDDYPAVPLLDGGPQPQQHYHDDNYGNGDEGDGYGTASAIAAATPSLPPRRRRHWVDRWWRWCGWIYAAAAVCTTGRSSSSGSSCGNTDGDNTLTGLGLDAYARATIGMSSIFLGPALLALAEQAATATTTTVARGGGGGGCDRAAPALRTNDGAANDGTAAVAAATATTADDDDCTSTAPATTASSLLYGFRPSSLLTNLAAVSGVFSSLALPLFGSMVDHTDQRRLVGAVTAAALTGVKAAEGLLLLDVVSTTTDAADGGNHPNHNVTWLLLIVALQVVSALLFQLHITASYAYVAELGRSRREEDASGGLTTATTTARASRHNTTLFIILYASTLLFMLEVMGLSALLGGGNSGSGTTGKNTTASDVTTARLSQLVTVVTCAPCFYYSWTRWLGHRLAQSRVPPGLTLATAGYRKLSRTLRRIRTRDNPVLLYFLLAVVCAEAASGALIAVSTTYMKNVLQMNGSEIGTVFFAVLLAGVPGSKVGSWLTVAVLGNPVHSVLLCNVYFIASTTAAAVLLRGPADKRYAVGFGALWGVALGWLPPQHTTAYVALIPPGQEAEFMGLYLLAGQILSWLPPAVFTVLNERRVPMAYGLASLGAYFCAAIVFLLLMGRYEDAVALVQRPPDADDDGGHELGQHPPLPFEPALLESKNPVRANGVS